MLGGLRTVHSMVTGRLRMHSSLTCTLDFVFVPTIRRTSPLFSLLWGRGLTGDIKVMASAFFQVWWPHSMYTVGIVRGVCVCALMHESTLFSTWKTTENCVKRSSNLRLFLSYCSVIILLSSRLCFSPKLHFSSLSFTWLFFQIPLLICEGSWAALSWDFMN